jgi:hypothetical protein
MPRLLLLAALALAACGADGAPEPPTKSGITVTGEAEVGVVMVK